MEHFESKIVSVEVHDKSICHSVTYKKERKQLFGLIKPLPSGYYNDSDSFLGNEDDLLNGSYRIKPLYSGEDEYVFTLICENKKAYYRPYVTVEFESGKFKQYKFNTIAECNDYANKLREGWSHLLLVDVNKLMTK